MYCWWVTQNPFPALLYSSVLLPNPYRSICCICLLFLKSLQCPLYMLYQHYKFSNDFHLFSLLQLPLLHIAVCVFSPLLVIWLEGYWECERDKKISVKTRFWRLVYLWFVYYIFLAMKNEHSKEIEGIMWPEILYHMTTNYHVNWYVASANMKIYLEM